MKTVIITGANGNLGAASVKKFLDEGRPSGDAAQRQAERNRYRNEEIGKRSDSYQSQGLGAAEAEARAASEVDALMKGLNVLHAPDFAAGGTGAFGADVLGDAKANQAIGRQWNTKKPGSENSRIDEIEDAKKKSKKVKRKFSILL